MWWPPVVGVLVLHYSLVVLRVLVWVEFAVSCSFPLSFFLARERRPSDLRVYNICLLYMTHELQPLPPRRDVGWT